MGGGKKAEKTRAEVKRASRSAASLLLEAHERSKQQVKAQPHWAQRDQGLLGRAAADAGGEGVHTNNAQHEKRSATSLKRTVTQMDHDTAGANSDDRGTDPAAMPHTNKKRALHKKPEPVLISSAPQVNTWLAEVEDSPEVVERAGTAAASAAAAGNTATYGQVVDVHGVRYRKQDDKRTDEYSCPSPTWSVARAKRWAGVGKDANEV